MNINDLTHAAETAEARSVSIFQIKRLTRKLQEDDLCVIVDNVTYGGAVAKAMVAAGIEEFRVGQRLAESQLSVMGITFDPEPAQALDVTHLDSQETPTLQEAPTPDPWVGP